MELLRDMELFVAVAETKSFSRAARALGMPISSLSRRIAELETKVRLQLLRRSTRGVELTEAGEAYFVRCRDIVAAAGTAHEELKGFVDEPRGTVRISSTPDVTLTYLAPLFVKFAQLYPAVAFDLDLSPRRVDLISERFDVAVRVGTLPDSALTVRRLAETRLALYASPAYVEREGAPSAPAALAERDCIRLLTLDQPQPRWTLVRGRTRVDVQVRGRFATNNMSLILRLVRDGMGIGVIDEALAVEDLEAGSIVRVLPAWHPPPTPIWALTPSRLLPAKTRLLLDCLSDHIESTHARIERLRRSHRR